MLSAAPVFAATALFPKPLHLVERIDDPFAKTSKTVDEYCYGNRVVTVLEQRVTILDNDAQTITVIDHGQGTYSVTRFDEIANARPKTAAARGSVAPKVTPNGMKTSRGGRSVETFSIEVPHTKVVIGVDRTVTLSRAAVEVLIGSSYPNVHRPEHDAMLDAAAPASRGGRIAATSAGTDPGDGAGYALPSERTITIDTEGGPVVTHISVLRSDAALPPQNAALIDPGAKRVESPTARFAREMKAADTIPVAPRQ